MKIEHIKVRLEKKPAIAIYYSKKDVGETDEDPIQDIINIGMPRRITEEFIVIYLFEDTYENVQDIIEELEDIIDEAPYKISNIEFITGTFLGSMEIEIINVKTEIESAIAIYYSKDNICKTDNSIQNIIDSELSFQLTDEYIIIYLYEEVCKNIQDMIKELKLIRDKIAYEPTKMKFISGIFRPRI